MECTALLVPGANQATGPACVWPETVKANAVNKLNSLCKTESLPCVFV